MQRALLVSVRFHDGRYHGLDTSGRPEWPPSPARLFQALVAGAAQGHSVDEKDARALRWLEKLSGASAPIIAAPPVRATRGFANYVPNNNDMAIKDGVLKRIGKEKTDKLIKPLLFDSCMPLLYAWTFENDAEAERHACTICEIANKLYQLGRGVDTAWAWGEIIDAEELEERLGKYGGALYRPASSGEGNVLLCPFPGSLDSLVKRHEKAAARFLPIVVVAPTKKDSARTKQVGQTFSQAPKPRFVEVPYNSPSTFLLFDIRKGGGFEPQPFDRIVALVETIRDLAAKRLKESGWRREDTKREPCIEKVFIGRNSAEADKARRIRITPLPSIGHAQVGRSIRRVLVTVPPDCPIAADDVAWAFSGLAIGSDKETGEIIALVPAQDRTMLQHYGVEDSAPASLWRTVTPAALPERAARRRIDPRRMREEAKGGAERARENAVAASAVRQALRHAGIETSAQAIRVQREPFESKGQRSEAFARETRFVKERLWHVEVALAQAIRGPLLIGDGRYLGLGLMAPVRRTEGIFAFAVMGGLTDQATPRALARALRRAVMARVQEKIGRRTLPAFFTGHAADGTPLRSGRHEHLFFVFDALRKRLLIVAPHILAHRDASEVERDRYIPLLEDAVTGFQELRAGATGKLVLAPTFIEQTDDPLFVPSLIWRSVTPYRVTRHAKLGDAAAALEADILAECLREGLPRPRIEVFETLGKPGSGLFGRAQLTFRSAVPGPLILGRDRHFGGGLFEATR